MALTSEDACNARKILWVVLRLGQDICQLRHSRDGDRLHVAILDDFICKICVFPDVNVLGAFPAADDFVSPFNAPCFVLMHWGLLWLHRTHQFLAGILKV